MFEKFLNKLFRRRRRRNPNGDTTESYASAIEFVSQNKNEVKALLGTAGASNLAQRLEDIASMTSCHCMALCQKLSGLNKYMVVEASNRNVCKRGTTFTWAHSQVMASSDAKQVIDALPFEQVGGTGFISVPVKNDRNMLVGLLLGISTVKLTDVDAKTQFVHLLAPTFEPEIRCMRYKQEGRQYEQRIISLNQDIEVMSTDLRKEQERSQENRELKSIFLTNLSHEIRTPMTAIMGFIDLLNVTDDEADRHKFLDIIKENGSMLLAVIDNLIDISKLQSSYMMKAACPVQLNELLTQIKDKYQARLNEMGKDVNIETSFALEAPKDTIWFSDEIITKILEQLMDNAVKFTMTGRITISYSMTLKEAIFYVADTGPGIKTSNEDKLFDMFGSVDASEQEVPELSGKGIGLAVAKKYVSLVNGEIHLVPSYKEGTCVSFSIPIEKL